jgi:hypothetical protein
MERSRIAADRVGTASPHVGLNGTIDFDFPILGIDIDPDKSEDSVFGAIGTSYNGSGEINFSHPIEEDVLGLSADQRTLVMFLSVGGGGKDSMRIFTATPEPTTSALALAQATLCLAMSRRWIAAR